MGLDRRKVYAWAMALCLAVVAIAGVFLFRGALAIGVMLAAPNGLWGYVQARFSWSLFPVGYRIKFPNSDPDSSKDQTMAKRPKPIITCASTGAIHTPHRVRCLAIYC